MLSSTPFIETITALIDSIGGSDARAVEFNSMVIYGDNGQSRL
jgi:hypothetical protein